MIKIDTHFHPNLYFFFRFLTRWKVRSIWQKFKKFGLDAVIVTEHSFKRPVSAYRYLLKHKPHDAKTQLIPGVEVLTKEYCDLIVFSRDTYVYTRQDIMTPRYYTIQEVIDVVNKDPKLYGVIPHPMTFGNTWLQYHRDMDGITKDIQQIKMVEKYNPSFRLLKRLMEMTKLSKIFPKFYRRIHDIENFSGKYIPDETVILWGSDAHHCFDIGSYLAIDTVYKDYDDLFNIIVSGQYSRAFHYQKLNLYNSFCTIFKPLNIINENIVRFLKLYHTEFIQDE